MEAPEEDADFLTLASPAQGVTLRVTPRPFSFGDGVEPGTAMAWSNEFGWSVVVQPDSGFSLFSLDALRGAFESATPHSTPEPSRHLTVPTEAPVDHIRFAMGDQLVVAALRDSSLVVWRLKSLVVEKDTNPLRTIPAVPGRILQVLPNPAPSSPLVCVISSSSPPVIHNLETSTVHSTFDAPSRFEPTCASWSVKGKQLAVGTRDGRILQFTPEGELKAELAVPSSLEQSGWQVESLEWLENHVFWVTYSKPLDRDGQPQHEDEVVVLTRDPKRSNEVVEQVRFMDPTPAFGMMDRHGKRWVVRLKNWEPFKHLLFVANAPSSDIGLLSQSSSSSSSWNSLALSDSSRPTLPQSSLGEEVCPLALEVDLSNSHDDHQVSIWCLTSEGVLVRWNVTNDRAPPQRYEGFVESKDVSKQHDSVTAETTTTSTTTTPSTTFGGGGGGFGGFAASSGSSSKPATAFGSTAFGSFGGANNNSSGPAFGGAAAPPSSKPPTFGATSGFGSFAATPTSSSLGGGGGGFAAFGSSASSSPSATTMATTTTGSGGGFSAFGSKGGGATTATGGGGGGFGAFTKPAAGASVFGSGGSFGSSSSSTTTPSAFGSSTAFGGGSSSSSSKPTTTTKSVFGGGGGSTTGFGGFSSSTPSTFGSSPAPKPSFSFAASPATKTTTTNTTRPRGTNDSDEEEEEEEQGDKQDDRRVDEPPDLEPTKSGLDIGQSMKEAQEAKAATAGGGGGTFGFGQLGVSGSSSSQTTNLGNSIFGAPASTESKPTAPSATTTTTATTPAFGAATAFGSLKPATGFSFGQRQQQPASESAKDTPDASPKPAFGSTTSGGFGAFATKTDEGEKPKSAFSSFGTVDKTSPFSSAATTTPTTTTTESKPTPSAFGFGGTASTAFPKPASTGGFGAFASSSPGGGFGSTTTTPKPASGFSFAPKPASPLPSPSPAPSFSFAPTRPAATTTTDAKARDIEEKPSSTKSLFGFASSPTDEKDADSSLLGRLGAQDKADEEEESEGSDGFDDEEKEQEEEQEEDEEEYEEEENQEEDEVEEEEEEEEEDQVEVQEEETDDVPASSSPSLLSRLSPAPQPRSPAASPSPPAVKTEDKAPSFSFGTPSLPTTTTPETATPAAAKSPLSFATTTPSPAASPSPSPLAAPSSKPPPTSFLRFASTAPRASSPLASSSVTSPLSSFAPPPPSSVSTKAFGGFSGFGTAPAPPNPETKPFSFGSAPPPPPAAAPVPSETKPETKPFSFGSAPPPPPAAAPVPLETKPAPIGLFGSSQPAKAPSVGFSFGAPPADPKPVEKKETPVVEKEVKREAISLAKASTPRLGPELVKGQQDPVVQEKGMAGEFLKAYLGIQRDFDLLRANAQVIKGFARDVAVPLDPSKGEDWDDRHWSLGDLERLRELTREIKPRVESLHDAALQQKQRTAELQSQMLKAETKREEAARFVRAKNDPAFAKMIRIRQLGPEQIEHQRKIRLQMEAVRSRVEQLEDHLMALKSKVNEDQKGRTSFKAPSLDSVNRAVRNITAAVTEKTFELDQLAHRLDQVRLGPSPDATGQRRHRSPSVALDETINQSSVLRRSTAANARVSPASIAAAKAGLDTEKSTANLKATLLALRADKPAVKVNETATAPVQGVKAQVAANLQLPFAKGVVTADRLPRPRRQAPPRSPRAALSPIPLLPVFPASPALVKSTPAPSPPNLAVAPTNETPLSTTTIETTRPVKEPTTTESRSPLTFGSTTEARASGGGGAPLFPVLNLKSAPQFSFNPVASTPPPAAASGTRGSAARTSKDRNHSSAAQLKPASATPSTTTTTSFDWGPLPTSMGAVATTTTPSKAPFSFAATPGATSTPPPGINPAGFVSLGSPFAASSSDTTATATATTPAAKPAFGNGASFSFATASTTPSKPPAFSFGLPADDDDDDEDDEHEDDEHEEEEPEEEEEEEEEWDGDEEYDPEEEGLDTIGEEEEEE
ncbi:hypothetical protein JCM3766R1_002730 [Sporobolomyces carnicolor]